MTGGTTHGGARKGAGQKTVENGRLRRSAGAAVAAAEKQYISGRARGKLIALLGDGAAQPFEIMFEAMRFHHGLAVYMETRAAGEVPDSTAQGKYISKASEHYDKAVKHAAQVLPYAYPKLASIEHTGSAVEPGMKVGTLNVFLQSAIDRLASKGGEGRDLLENVAGGAGGPGLRLGVLEQTGAAPAEVQSKDG